MSTYGKLQQPDVTSRKPFCCSHTHTLFYIIAGSAGDRNAAQLIIENRAVLIEYARGDNDKGRDARDGRDTARGHAGRNVKSDWLCDTVILIHKHTTCRFSIRFRKMCLVAVLICYGWSFSHCLVSSATATTSPVGIRVFGAAPPEPKILCALRRVRVSHWAEHARTPSPTRRPTFPVCICW